MNKPARSTHIGRLTGIGAKTDFTPISRTGLSHFSSSQIDFYNENGFLLDIPILKSRGVSELKNYLAACALDEKRRAALGFNGHVRSKIPADLFNHLETLACLNDLIGPDVICFISQYINKLPGSIAPNEAAPKGRGGDSWNRQE